MSEIKEIVLEMRAAAKRRRSLLILTPILFVIAAGIAIHFIEPKYESTTTIQVLKDDNLNPSVLYDLGIPIETRNRLESINEIIYSRAALDKLIDSLNLDRNVTTKSEKQRLIEKTQNSIETELSTSDAFEIRFTNTDPELARAGVDLLTNHFIETKLRLSTRKLEETVNFFTNKMEELENIVIQQRDQSVTATSQRLRELPSSADALHSRLENIEERINSIELRLIQEEEKLAILSAFQSEPNINDGIKHLFRLPLSDTQFGDELTDLLNEYETMQQQFTENYPSVRAQAEQVKQVANRIPATVESNIRRLNSQKEDLNQQKERVVDNMQQYFVANQIANSQQSDFSIYEELRSDMRVQLEQAKIARDIGIQAADQFVILDAAVVPDKPASPNKPLIIAIALIVGIILGIAFSSVAEIMDTTLRIEEEIPYQKPIIAYLN